MKAAVYVLAFIGAWFLVSLVAAVVWAAVRAAQKHREELEMPNHRRGFYCPSDECVFCDELRTMTEDAS